VSLPYYPFYPSDFEAKTSHLTLEEDGAYNRLLRLMWMTPGCSLPDDPAWVARRLRVDAATYDRVVAPIISEFFKRARKRIYSPRLMREFDSAKVTHELRVSAGKKGGRSPKPLKSAGTEESRAKAGPKQPEPEPEPDKKEGGGVVREAGKTDREAILQAIGVDPISGITGPSGRMIGTQADMAEVARWLDLPGITVPVILTEVRRIMAGKRDGPPSTFRFFTKAIQRLSGEISRPALDPITPTTASGAKHERQRFDQAINQLADGLSAGTVGIGLESRDPFAARPRGNA